MNNVENNMKEINDSCGNNHMWEIHESVIIAQENNH